MPSLSLSKIAPKNKQEFWVDCKKHYKVGIAVQKKKCEICTDNGRGERAVNIVAAAQVILLIARIIPFTAV